MKASKFLVSLAVGAAVLLFFGLATAMDGQPAPDSLLNRALEGQVPERPVVPSSADALLAAAEAKAAKENKNVFLIFHASWCIWCHRFDDLLNAPTLKPFFDKNYVIVNIDCLESGAQTSMENAGWKEMMTTYGAFRGHAFGGTGQGVPYWLFLDPKGKILATCRSPFDPDPKGEPSNMGFPDNSQPKDLTFFVSVIEKSAPHYEASFETNLRSYLRSLSY